MNTAKLHADVEISPYNSTKQQAIDSFWMQGNFKSFQGVNDKRVNYAEFIHPISSRALVFSPGRIEGYLKYQELIYDFFHQGFSLFVIDHRGQGLSERLLDNPHKGYVEDFEDYTLDFQKFMQQVVLPNCPVKPYLLTHSMGGAIAIRYMQLQPEVFQAVVLSSPMIMFNTGKISLTLATKLINALATLNQKWGSTPWYFPGQSDYQAKPFSGNELTHDKQRYQRFQEVYQQNPALQLGGVTTHWMQMALMNHQLIYKELYRLSDAICILQSGADTIVDNHAMNDFSEKLHRLNPNSCPTGHPFKIENARHELFMEQDCYRNPAIQATLQWFEKHTE